MPTLAFQMFALVLLALGIGLTYWIWVRPLGRLDFQQRGALLLTALTLTGGLIGAFFWWADEPRSFAWDLPPLASRMLAAAGLSFAVLGALVMRRPTYRRLRLLMLALFIYLAPLAAVILLFHLDRFDLSASISYGFFAIVGLMTAGAAWYLFRPVWITSDTPAESQPPRSLTRAWLGFVAGLTGLWGLALFLTDSGPSPLIWAWPGDLLSSRLIGVMLLTIAAGSLFSLRAAGRARLMLAMTIVYSLGLAAASLWNLASGKPVKEAYLVVFGLIFLGSTVLGLLERRRPVAGASPAAAGG